MTTITSAPPRSAEPNAATSGPPVALASCPPAEKRIAIRGLSWELYDALSDAIDPRQRVFLAYDGKDLEIMVKGRVHEHFKDRFGKLVTAITDDLHIDCSSAGETTWKRPEIARGLEADQCYYFLPEKLTKDRDAVKRRSQDIADYPNPDLAVEIDISPSEIDRQAIYRALQVKEIWRFDGESVGIDQLGSNGEYSPSEMSCFLPIRADEVQRWIVEENADDPAAWRAAAGMEPDGACGEDAILRR